MVPTGLMRPVASLEQDVPVREVLEDHYFMVAKEAD